jgi:hypothetical protein
LIEMLMVLPCRARTFGSKRDMERLVPKGSDR